MSYIVKIKYENNLRRLTLVKREIETESFTFAHLEARIRELFQLPAVAPLAITYTDEEDDVVTMGNDQDLKDALIEQALNPLRIHVAVSQPKSGDKTETGKAVDLSNRDAFLRALGERVSQTFSQAPGTMRHAFQPYEQLFEGVKSPAQIPCLVENVMQKVVSQVASAVNNGSAAAAAAAKFGAPAPSDFGSAAYSGPPKDSQPPQAGDTATGAGPSSAASEGANSQNQASLTVHHGVVCDSCEIAPIVGNRWKSNVKFDYDLCSSCYEKHGNEKEYTKVEVPKFRPRHMQGPHRMGSWSGGSFPGPMCHRQMGTPPFHPMGPPPPFSSPGPQNGHWHGGKPFCMRGPFGGPNGRHNCGPPMMGSFDKLHARFVCDVTIFDGTEVAPETHFVKIWRLRNSGSASWPVNTCLVFQGGDELGNVSSVPLEIPDQGLAPEAEMEVSVDMVAPEKPGRYVSHWRLASPAGPKFGQRLSVIIQIVPKTILDGTVPELVSVGDDAPTREAESGAGTMSQTTPAEPADEGEITEQAGDLTMLSFESFVGKLIDASDVSPEAEKEQQLVQKQITEVINGILINNGGDVAAINASQEAVEIAQAEDEAATENVASIPVLTEAEPAGVLGVGVEEEKMVAPKISETSPALEANMISETSPALEGNISYPALEVTQDEGPIAYPVVNTAAIPRASESDEEGLSTTKALLAKLDGMGFTDSKLNYELLEKNGFDLRKTLDDLCAAEEWDPILEELEEMGFYDTSMNRRLMFKNNGSVKRVVKELVQMYRDIQGKREKVE